MGLWIPQATEVGLALGHDGVALPHLPMTAPELVSAVRAAEHADRCVALAAGQAVCDGTATEHFSSADVLTRARVTLRFIVILAVVLPFFYSGQVTAGSSEIAIRTPVKDLSWAALGFGALLALRFLAIGISGLIFAFTTHPGAMPWDLAG